MPTWLRLMSPPYLKSRALKGRDSWADGAASDVLDRPDLPYIVDLPDDWQTPVLDQIWGLLRGRVGQWHFLRHRLSAFCYHP